MRRAQSGIRTGTISTGCRKTCFPNLIWPTRPFWRIWPSAGFCLPRWLWFPASSDEPQRSTPMQEGITGRACFRHCWPARGSRAGRRTDLPIRPVPNPRTTRRRWKTWSPPCMTGWVWTRGRSTARPAGGRYGYRIMARRFVPPSSRNRSRAAPHRLDQMNRNIIPFLGFALLAWVLASSPASTHPDNYKVEENVEFTRAQVSLRLDAHIPPGKGPFPAVILVHGGGWTTGSKTANFVIPLFDPLTRAGYAWFTI